MFKYLLLIISCLITCTAFADLDIPIYFVGKTSAQRLAGHIHISETPYGLLFTPALQQIKPGLHGFHIHDHPSCADHALAAGGHFDPHHSEQHLGPYDELGHLGDLPALYVTTAGIASLPVLAPRLTTLEKIKGHTIVIHEGSDNYADTPAKLGGGGNRILCGIIQ